MLPGRSHSAFRNSRPRACLLALALLGLAALLAFAPGAQALSGPALAQNAKLTGSGETGAGYFGYSVAVSADGNTALVGGYVDNSNQGVAWIFTRTGGTWTQQGPKVTPSDAAGSFPEFGSSVALSADGNTALIGAMYDSLKPGAAWIFTRTGSTWTQQGSKLTPSNELGTGYVAFGTSVSCPPTAPRRSSARRATTAASAPPGCSPTRAEPGLRARS